jgi:transposase
MMIQLPERGGCHEPRRYEIADFEWSIIEPLLPNKPRGVPRADDRMVLNGI